MAGIVRTAPLRALLVAGLMLSGCSLVDGPDDTRTAAPDWETVERTLSKPGLVIEKVRYRSGNLGIDGQVCRPDGPGPYPVLIWNHGGFSGLGDWNNPGGPCARLARSGWVFAESSYRGEDASDGRIEVCDGEVDDVLSMLAVVRAKSYADTKRMAMVGLSHGGCITARAVARGAPVQVAVDSAGPANWVDIWRHLTRQAASPSVKPALRGVSTRLLKTIETALGGTPSEVPSEYARRSPVESAEKIAQWDGSLLVMHGGADRIVPPSQACGLAREVGDFAAYRFSEAGRALQRPPSDCHVTFHDASELRPGFRDQRYLLMYDGLEHTVQDLNRGRMVADYTRFLASKLGP